MKKDFPFVLSIVFALTLHFVLGLFLKYHPLAAAAPVFSVQPKEPVTLRFVEVPPDARSVAQTPATHNLSDANRIAGPLIKAMPQPARSSSPRSGGSKSPADNSLQKSASTVSREPTSESSRPDSNEKNTDIPQNNGPKLAQSLQNLDHYIGSGGSGGGQGNDSGMPEGDPGSGVYFDTQGYDLGPWANRVIAIVKSNWIIPVAAELGLKGVTGISFKIDRSGNILDLKIVSQSGVPSFDQAALNSLKTSSPLPALPADFPRDLLPGVFRFYYNTPVPE